jgi:hypothetical protein
MYSTTYLGTTVQGTRLGVSWWMTKIDEFYALGNVLLNYLTGEWQIFPQQQFFCVLCHTLPRPELRPLSWIAMANLTAYFIPAALVISQCILVNSSLPHSLTKCIDTNYRFNMLPLLQSSKLVPYLLVLSCYVCHYKHLVVLGLLIFLHSFLIYWI